MGFMHIFINMANLVFIVFPLTEGEATEVRGLCVSPSPSHNQKPIDANMSSMSSSAFVVFCWITLVDFLFPAAGLMMSFPLPSSSEVPCGSGTLAGSTGCRCNSLCLLVLTVLQAALDVLAL